MRRSLAIKGFKRIHEEICLNDFDHINYLVGKNGSGKSSILSALTSIRTPEFADKMFSNQGFVKLKLDTESLILKKGEGNPVGAISLLTIIKQDGRWGNLNSIIPSDFMSTFTHGSPQDKRDCFSLLNETLIGLGESPIERKVISGEEFEDPVIKLIQNNKEVAIELLADGILSLVEFRFALSNLAKQLRLPGYLSQYSMFIVVLEEPENNMYPELQKKIPLALRDFFEELEPDVARKTFFFVSTHSPLLVVSAAKIENQKFYVVDSGSLVDIDSSSGVRTLVEESNGFTGIASALIAGEMLGFKQTDMGYPGNFCILEEASMATILNRVQDLGILNTSYQFIAAKGIAKAVDLKETMDSLEQLDLLLKCNLFYFNKYLMIIDNIDLSKQKSLDVRLKAISKRLNKSGEKDRFFQLSKDSLEDYYDNIQPGLTKKSKDEIASLSDPYAKGKCKMKFAEQVAKLINSKEDFKILFDSELDFLLER